MALTKLQRADLKNKYGGLCAYCGTALTDKWHADHLIPIRREVCFERGKGFYSGAPERPELDVIENMMPACPPCNIDKHAMSLEDWRLKLQRSCGVLSRSSSTYRHAFRFGLIVETGRQIVFHFETVK